ncbi:MAG TPA: beta-galactosidase [Terriglobia bacterium]|nr:beta-galactosidase [Terriglobia bacterium]
MRRLLVLSILACSIWLMQACSHGQSTRDLDELFSSPNVSSIWKGVFCDLRALGNTAIEVTFWKGYATTGLETTRLPVTDWSSWKSLQFNVDNPYPEPVSIYVRLSNRVDHPPAETYTGGTFDGSVIGPGRNTVEISLEAMRSPTEQPIDPHRIAYLGIAFQPLFLRDGLDLKFTDDKTFRLSQLRLSKVSAKLQKQPYGDLLFRESDPNLAALRKKVEVELDVLRGKIEQAKAHGIETAYAEIFPFLSQIAFNSRLVAFWQNRAEEQRKVLDFLLEGTSKAAQELQDVIDDKAPQRIVPPIPDYGRLAIRGSYFRLGDAPILLFGMLYNHQGPLLRWFANSQTDYGTQLVAGGTRHDVEHQPIWEAYQKYPETHRVGWDHADHIIRDRSSWEVVGPPVNVCLESPRSREAVAKTIETFEHANAGDHQHLVQNLGYEYTYVCYCEFTKRMWADWLQHKHGNVGTANLIWGTHFTNFVEVPMPRQEQAASNRALWLDWSSFNLYRFLEQIRWTRDQIRKWEPSKPLTVGSPYFDFSPAFWTGVDEEELADSGITSTVLEENYELDTLMPEYLHTLASSKPVIDFEYHGVIHQILPSFLHGDAAISMWWWNDRKQWTPNEPINEWASSFPQSYTIQLQDIAKAMRDALDLRRLSREIAALASAPRPVALLYSKSSMLQQLPEQSRETDNFPYLSELRRTYKASQSAGLYVGLTTEKKILTGDLRGRKILVLTGAEFIPARVVTAILKWVDQGGTVIVSPDSLLADEYTHPSETLHALGVRLVKREPPQLKHGEGLVTDCNLADLPRMPLWEDRGKPFAVGGTPLQAAGGRQILEGDHSLVLARFQDGSPALLRVPKGHGALYWLAAPLDPLSWGRFLAFVADKVGLRPDLRVSNEKGDVVPNLEYRVTVFKNCRLAYFYNNSERDMRVSLQPAFNFSRILDRRTEMPVTGLQMSVPAQETAILEFR